MNKRSKLASLFPMIRTREDILQEIEGNTALKKLFEGFSEQEQKRFLDMCTGERGVKILYDAYFKEIMNPEYAPNRMSSLLSVLLGKEVTVESVLPTESRLADEESLLIMDILVKTAEGELMNCEVQKIGYRFAGERASCYSADLLLRQYKRVREQSNRKTFSYQNIKDVYTIVFFETSQAVFHDFYKANCLNFIPETSHENSHETNDVSSHSVNHKTGHEVLIHRMKQVADTGIDIHLLQKFVFVPLDIFDEIYQNKSIDTKLAAWLMFLSTDKPERILELVQRYPEFRPMYEDIYNLCRNVESVMEMYSKELAELDRNTVHLMIDEYRETIDRQAKEHNQEINSLTKKHEQEIDSLTKEHNQKIDSLTKEIETLKAMLKHE